MISLANKVQWDDIPLLRRTGEDGLNLALLLEGTGVDRKGMDNGSSLVPDESGSVCTVFFQG